MNFSDPIQKVDLRPWWQIRLLLLVLAFCGFLSLGCVPLIDEDEGEYSEVAAEMAASSHFLAPTLNGQAFYEKPALLFWLQAPLVQWVGSHEWAFRFPPAIASLTWALAMLLWWRTRRGEAESLIALWIGVSTLGITIAGRAATMDSLIILWLTLTFFDVWSFIETEHRFFVRRAGLWCALGFLTKGPIAVVIPVLVLGVFGIATPSARKCWRGFLDPWAWLIFWIGATPWFIWYGLHSDGAFLKYFFFRENLGRVGGSLQGHSGSPMYYLMVLPFILLPYSALLWRLIRKTYRDWDVLLTRYLILWFAVVLVVFSIAGTKLPHYLLYGCTPLFLLAAPELLRPGNLRWRLFLALPSVLLPMLALALPALAAHFAVTDANPYIREMLARGQEVLNADYVQFATVWAVVSAMTALSIVFYLPNKKLYRYTIFLPGFISVIGVSWVLIPAVSHLQQDPVRSAAYFARTLNETVVSDNRMPSFSVYLGHPTEIRPIRAGDIVFGRLDHLDQLGSQHQVLFAQGGLRVVRVQQP